MKEKTIIEFQIQNSKKIRLSTTFQNSIKAGERAAKEAVDTIFKKLYPEE